MVLEIRDSERLSESDDGRGVHTVRAKGLAEDKIVAKLQWSRQAWPVVLPWDPLSDSGVTTESGLSGLGERQ